VNKTNPDCPSCLGGWSTEGVATLVDPNGEVNCISQHLTVSLSFFPSFSI